MRTGTLLVGSIMVLLASCAFPIDRSSTDTQPLDPDAFAAVFDERAQCWGAWGALLRDWKNHGGSFKSSMRETRQQIAADQSSNFARVVRRAWARQAIVQAGRWQWPVEHDRSRAVMWGATGEGYVPTHCEGIFWLDDLVWDELRFDNNGNPIAARRFVETPVDMSWDSPNAQHWTMFWLFAKVDLIPTGPAGPNRFEGTRH
jgi:hypothetical protein